MTKQKLTTHFPWKPLLYALGALAAGVCLLILSRYVKPKAKPADSQPAVATAPADEQPISPGRGRLPRRSRADAAAASVSSLILLFSMACFIASCVCLGWLIIEIRNNRPAWQRQTKFPKMRE